MNTLLKFIVSGEDRVRFSYEAEVVMHGYCLKRWEGGMLGVGVVDDFLVNRLNRKIKEERSEWVALSDPFGGS